MGQKANLTNQVELNGKRDQVSRGRGKKQRGGRQRNCTALTAQPEYLKAKMINRVKCYQEVKTRTKNIYKRFSNLDFQ